MSKRDKGNGNGHKYAKGLQPHPQKERLDRLKIPKQNDELRATERANGTQ
jgi:hypothetical protein